MIVTDVSDTIHADSLALFALNIEILLADVTKSEKSKILTLTWPLTSSVTSRSNFWPCTGSSRTRLSNGVWNLEIGPVVWEISGGGPLGPPPAGRVTIQTPAGRGLRQVSTSWFISYSHKVSILPNNTSTIIYFPDIGYLWRMELVNWTISSVGCLEFIDWTEEVRAYCVITCA